MARIRSRIEEKAEGDFTSMIDIVFLLLIFFILQPFKNPDLKMEMHLPKAGAPTPPEIDDPEPPLPTIQVKVMAHPSSKASFRVNGRRVAAHRLNVELLKESAGMVEVPVAISPEKNVAFTHVMKALDECAEAGMLRVSFADS
ncbi:MAG: ExbD/TolR family protein [Planctomycetota bacterium]